MRVYTLYIVVVSVERGVLAVFVTFRIKQQRRFLFTSQAKSLPSGATTALLAFPHPLFLHTSPTPPKTCVEAKQTQTATAAAAGNSVKFRFDWQRASFA